jgi:hypothetical protein
MLIYSSDSQREESIEGQLRECKDFAERNEFTVLNTYVDRAMSAKSDNRPEFQKMIKDSAKGCLTLSSFGNLTALHGTDTIPHITRRNSEKRRPYRVGKGGDCGSPMVGESGTSVSTNQFMKKSQKTPQREIDTAKRRLEVAGKEPKRYEPDEEK